MQDKVIQRCIYGSLARLLSLVVPVKKQLWVFGADYGNTYREGSKYLLEFMLKNHREYDCVFVTRSKNVISELRSKDIPCVDNYSLKGVWLVVRSECVFTTQAAADILFAFKRKCRKFYYLMHGMPMKVALCVLSKSDKSSGAHRGFWAMVKAWVTALLTCDRHLTDSVFVSATSDFFAYWMRPEFDNKTPVKVLGMPRNDALFQPWRMDKEKWVADVKSKFVITYMPTHRRYGKGQLSPTPFERRPDVQAWMQQNNVVLIVKNHPNMLRRFPSGGYHPYESSTIRDITTADIDPMTAIYHSDVLITDYSSVWMDYLLLRRPIVFYIYDNFAKDDVGLYYDPIQENVGHPCYSEDELFRLIKHIKANYEAMRPAGAVVHKFHKYVDGNSCERYFNEITDS